MIDVRIEVRAILLACVVVGSASACASREHMNDGYSRKSRVFFAKQHVHAEATTGSAAGLDSEEAALIQGRYRKSIGGAGAGSGEKDSPSRVLLLQESDRAKPSDQ
jgi:hypothetical protein